MKKYAHKDIPKYDELIVPVFEALKQLGGSGTVSEIDEKVNEIMGLPEEIFTIPQSETDTRSVVEYRVAWARTYLKKYGLIENSSRAVWALTPKGVKMSKDDVNVFDVKRYVHSSYPKKGRHSGKDEITEEVEQDDKWKEILLGILYKLPSDVFERLCKRILRESGFTQVEVTGKVCDKGIDGKGILRIGGLISFKVIFQCKRFKDSVSSPLMRDFRGALEGRADKGLFITTGTFTREAIEEANRDGVASIDLINGDMLCEKLKDLGLGVKSKMVESVEIDSGWFSEI